MCQSKTIIHQLYNELSQQQNMNEITDVLLKVYEKVNQKNETSLINRLVNYLYFTSFTNKIKFSNTQTELIKNLEAIGKFAGLNGVYRSDYGDKNQF